MSYLQKLFFNISFTSKIQSFYIWVSWLLGEKTYNMSSELVCATNFSNDPINPLAASTFTLLLSGVWLQSPDYVHSTRLLGPIL